MLEKVKQSNKEARAHHEGPAEGEAEESKTTGEFDKSIQKLYSRKLQKDLLERAVFMSIKIGDFKQAMAY